MIRPMQDLPAGTVFEKFTGSPRQYTRYQVLVSAADDPRGHVRVRNLSMTDAEAADLLATAGAVEPGCDPRDGFFAYSRPVDVTVLQTA